MFSRPIAREMKTAYISSFATQFASGTFRRREKAYGG
jgi:hypothetical protein